MNATPRPPEGVVTWNMTTVCNLHCSYCTQRHKSNRGRPPRAAEGFIAAFSRLPGRWEIKLSGGEPFTHPDLDTIVSSIAALGHRVSVVTNFTASRDRLTAFVTAARGRIGVFACSLHLEHVNDTPKLDEFIDRACWLAQLLLRHAEPGLSSPHLCVTSVATRTALPRLPELAERFGSRGISFKIQPEKQDRDVIGYTETERAAIFALGGHNMTGDIRHSFRDRPCWAGSRSFILDDLGAAWRCYPARRYKLESLGDFTGERFTLNDGPRPCLYDYCNCTVPIARGMMPTDHPLSTEAEE